MHNKKSFVYNMFSKHSQYSWRALFSFVSLLTTATTLLCFDKIQAQDWVTVAQWLAGFFIAGETVKKFSSKTQTEQPQE